MERIADSHRIREWQWRAGGEAVTRRDENLVVVTNTGRALDMAQSAADETSLQAVP